LTARVQFRGLGGQFRVQAAGPEDPGRGAGDPGRGAGDPGRGAGDPGRGARSVRAGAGATRFVIRGEQEGGLVASDPRIRASDVDRDRVATLLGKHHAAGRLNAAEFHERMEKAMDAATIAELDELMADLPVIDIYDLPDAWLRQRPRENPRQSLLPVDPDTGWDGLPAAGVGRPGGPGGPGVGRPGRPGRPGVGRPGMGGDGPLEELSPGATAVVAWATVATALIAIGVVTAIAIGALVPIWAIVLIPACGIFWLRFLIRHSRR